jgi:hypothetical protein
MHVAGITDTHTPVPIRHILIAYQHVDTHSRKCTHIQLGYIEVHINLTLLTPISHSYRLRTYTSTHAHTRTQTDIYTHTHTQMHTHTNRLHWGAYSSHSFDAVTFVQITRIHTDRHIYTCTHIQLGYIEVHIVLTLLTPSHSYRSHACTSTHTDRHVYTYTHMRVQGPLKQAAQRQKKCMARPGNFVNEQEAEEEVLFLRTHVN